MLLLLLSTLPTLVISLIIPRQTPPNACILDPATTPELTVRKISLPFLLLKPPIPSFPPNLLQSLY